MIINVSHFGTEELFFEKPESKNIDLSKLLFQKKTSNQTVKVSKPHRSNNSAFEMEIDLHIEELQGNYKGMSNAEIIQVQLRHFQKALDEAINEHYRSLTVIHGVGNGRLKQEVHKILTSMNLRFHDGAYSKYGFGATEVLIG
jgi:dsDNA-specific endonuclease/ATPase MutS2